MWWDYSCGILPANRDFDLSFRTISRMRSLLFSSLICPVRLDTMPDRRTFENLNEWIELYNENKHEKAVMLLVGNKVDLPVREVSYEEASNKAKLMGVEYY
jgi:GTPase SAR1 family protein